MPPFLYTIGKVELFNHSPILAFFKYLLLMKNIFVLALIAFSINVLAANKPNIILFYVDDLGWMDLSCQGSKFYETPAIDQLAAEGMRFTQAYTAHPRCVPARYGVVTGRYPSRGKVPGGGELLPEDYTIAEALRDGGYHTYFTGKWHLLFQEGLDNMPENQGFDVNVAGGAAGSPPTYFYPYRKGESTTDGQLGLLKTEVHGLEDGEVGEYITDRLTSETLEFIESHVEERGKDEPFFVYFSHYGVHTPFEAKPELIKKYEEKLKTMTYDMPAYEDTRTGDNKLRQDFPTYAAMIESVDQSMDSLMHKLKELGIEDNTIIVFTADNGGLSTRGNTRELATSNYPLRNGKGWLNEGGIREAFIVKWPSVTAAGTVSEEPTIATDLYPTFLDMAGLPQRPKDHLDGESIVKVLKGEDYNRTKALYWHSPAARPESTGDDNSSALRMGDYKIIDWYDLNEVELFNLKDDIGERENLAATMPEKKDEMLALLNATKTEVLNWERPEGSSYDFERFPFVEGFESADYNTTEVFSSYDGSTESDSWLKTSPQVLDRFWRGNFTENYSARVSSDAYEGQHAIQIDISNKAGGKALKLRTVNIPEGEYKVSFYAKTNAAGLGDAHIGFSTASSTMYALTTEYKKYSANLSVVKNSNGSTRLMIAYLNIDQAGEARSYSIWLDNLIIEELSSDIKENRNVASVECYPNPTTGLLYFSGERIEQLRVYSTCGRVQLHQRGELASIDISHLEKGFYFIKVFTVLGSRLIKVALV